MSRPQRRSSQLLLGHILHSSGDHHRHGIDQHGKQSDVWHVDLLHSGNYKLRKRGTDIMRMPNEDTILSKHWLLNTTYGGSAILVFEHKHAIFLLKPFSNCLRKTWFKFLGGSPSKFWPNSMPVSVCIAIQKSVFFLEKSQNGRWPQLFSP